MEDVKDQANTFFSPLPWYGTKAEWEIPTTQPQPLRLSQASVARTKLILLQKMRSEYQKTIPRVLFKQFKKRKVKAVNNNTPPPILGEGTSLPHASDEPVRL